VVDKSHMKKAVTLVHNEVFGVAKKNID